MFSAIKKALGMKEINYSNLLQNGAQIIDVRTPEEFRTGHIKGSINVPLQELSNNLFKIKKEKPVLTCCASGIRSAAAKQFLKANGFNEVYNGGAWRSLEDKIISMK